VLDRVGATIRERNQVRRQVKALAAEGKLSAIVLMALPFGIVAFLAVSNPSYVAAFTESLVGYALIVLSVIMLVIGGLWLRKVVSFRF
jgi:tight adherence protein B